jgi:tetratricopeptide (TPR) repeat protein
VYKKLGQFDKSLEYQLLALELKKSEPTSQRLTLYNIGENYIGLNQFDKALDYINKALDLAKLADDKRVIAYCYWSYGKIRARQKRYMDAIGFYQLSEKLWQELGEKRSLAQTYQDFGAAHRKLGNFAMAEEYLRKSSVFANEIHANDLEVKNYLYKFQLDSSQRKFERALVNLYRYNTLNDSLNNSSKAEQINRLQTIYETENRERENAALRAESSLRKAEVRSQQIIILAIGAGLLFSSVLLALVMRQRQKILRVNKQLNDKTEEVQSQAESLLKLNNELQNLNKNLETLVEERTAQVMKQNQRLAEYTFINAHKLRAPIASILGLINLLQKANNEEREQIYSYLKNCGEDLDSIIREIGRNLEGAIVEKD